MPQKIQIKRGNKKNLTILNQGEPAFLIDSKELFIGNNGINRQAQIKENLIINGNFQVICENFDAVTDKIIITPGTSRFLYGNFYITNASTSTGNVTISRPNNGFITIESTNAQISLEYREKLAEYLLPVTQTYSYIRPLLDQNVTLSFDYKNVVNDLNFFSGIPNSPLNKIRIPIGNGNITNTFPMKYVTTGNITFTRIVLLSTTQNNTYTMTIGNIKLEQGNYKTNFLPNPMYADIMAIEQVYRIYDIGIRSVNSNSGQVYNFNISMNMPICFRNSNATIIINTADVYSYDGIKQTGFTVSSSYQRDYNCITFQAKKINNTLKEIYLITNFAVDLRPY